MTPALKVQLEQISGWVIPEHDVLEWLLGKLPKHVGDQWLRIAPITDGMWAAYYITMGIKTAGQDEWADTPLDAVAKLCIELFQQNILTKEQRDD